MVPLLITHAFKGWLKAGQLLNVELKLVTFEVFHVFNGWLNFTQLKNIWFMFAKPMVFQLLKGMVEAPGASPLLKTSQPLNMPDTVVVPAVLKPVQLVPQLLRF